MNNYVFYLEIVFIEKFLEILVFKFQSESFCKFSDTQNNMGF